MRLRVQAQKNQPDLLDDTKICFEDDSAPIAAEAERTDKAHGKLVERHARTSQLLHGYSTFPGLHQVIEVKRKVTEQKTGKVTNEIEYGIASLSPREADAKTLMSLMRRHWGIENKNNHVRDDSWREDRQVWRRGNAAYSMSMLLSIAMNLLRARSPHWSKKTSMTERGEIVNDFTLSNLSSLFHDTS